MSETKYNIDCTLAELELGDVIQIPTMVGSPWSTGIVKNFEDDLVHIYRPYGHAADFSCTAGVICYTGLETFSLRRTAEKVHVYQRQPVR